MPEVRVRRVRMTLSSRVILFSIISYVTLVACLLLLWNVGSPFLGVKGRISELLHLEADYIGASLADKSTYVTAWLAARQGEALWLAQLERMDPRIDALFALRPGASAAIRQDLEKQLKALCQDSLSVSRVLLLRKEDSRVLADSSGQDSGIVFSAGMAWIRDTSGQLRFQDHIYSFATCRTAGGAQAVFVLDAPISSLLEVLRVNRFDVTRGLGAAIFDQDGRLITPFIIPDSKFRFGVGEIPVGKDLLDKMAAGKSAFVLKFGAESLSMGAVRFGLSTGEAMFIGAARARSVVVAELEQDSILMALLTLAIAGTASMLALRYIRSVLKPLSRLHAAVDSFGSDHASPLPEDAPGELGDITRAFASLERKVGSWKNELEREVEMRTRMFELTAELCALYATDASEKANISATDIAKSAFKADAAALFYVNGRNEHLFCMAGMDFPIALDEARWQESVRIQTSTEGVLRFGPWSPPGMDAPLPLWISYKLYSSGVAGGHIFLGRRAEAWNEEEEADLVAVVHAIAPIIQVRYERAIEEAVRLEAEEKLAGNERRLRSFLEGSRDMIYTADSNDIVTGINAAGMALLGWPEKSDILGKTFSSFALNTDDRALLLQKVKDVGYAADHEIVLKKRDGSGVFCLETAYAIRDAEGCVIELQGIVKDITERISSESALWKTNIELADANLKIQRTQALMIQHEKLASIGQLAAGVAHEINNPLGFLKSNHQMLEKYLKKIRAAWEEAKAAPKADLEEIERKNGLDYIFSQTDMIFLESDDGFGRIMHIVSNLKSFSRGDQGTGFGLYDVNAGIESTLIVAKNEIKYVAEVRKELGELPKIQAMGTEINQVILNILVNAAQAIEEQKREGKGLIEIRTTALGGNVIIGIRDDGPGIPEEIKLKIFDPFFTTKEPGKGTGLGLSISYDIIVSKHGGSLRVDSEPGKGTAFTIELPIAGPPMAAVHPA